MDTPEFLVWSLEYTCRVRGDQNGGDPERTERQLRAARAVSDARGEGRVFEGLCLDPPTGFRIADALVVYGGEAVVTAACRECPANARAAIGPDSLAGCYGLVALSADETLVHRAIERAIDQQQLGPRVAGRFLVTRPRWYGLWPASPLKGEELTLLSEILSRVENVESAFQRSLNELLTALTAAQRNGLALFTQLFPRGKVAGPWWQVASHCPQCHAPWNEAQANVCQVCGRAGQAAPPQRRHARGSRPYFPLDRLLGAEQARDLLSRYESFRAQRRSPDQAQTPLDEAPSNNPLAD